MEPLGGTVFRQTRTQVEDAFFEKEIEAQQTELANLEREKEASARDQENEESTLRNTRLQAKIDAIQRQIQEKQSQLIERIKSVSAEGRERIAFLQEDMADADEGAKIQLNNRLEDIRTEYELRANKLDQALQRSKESHPNLISRTA